MTIEEYVNNLETLVPNHFVENTKDWSTSDKMYAFLHFIQIKKIEEFNQSLEELKTLIYVKCK